MNQDEKTLIKKALSGHPAAIDELVERYSAFVSRVAWHFMKNSADAADVTQEVLLKAVSSLSQLKAVEGFQSWLYRITYHTSLNWLRARKKTVAVEDQELERIPADDPPSNLMLEHEEDVQQLDEAIKQLPYTYLVVLKMFYFDEMSIREIASKLHISEGSVKVQLHRAREMLKKKLRPHGKHVAKRSENQVVR